MTYQACDIDKLRDLVVRQERAKHDRYFEMGMGPTGWRLERADVERQLNTYMGQGTTVAALTKCVEEIEAEATTRVSAEGKRVQRRYNKQRAHAVLDAAMEVGRGADPKKTRFNPDRYHYSAFNHSVVDARFVEECEKVKKWIGDPWDDDDAS